KILGHKQPDQNKSQKTAAGSGCNRRISSKKKGRQKNLKTLGGAYGNLLRLYFNTPLSRGMFFTR
ncbi:MAG TPA: hypothetical protein VMT04_10480, partial [Terriglobales bacterium]|nr:hypothetical protein [Terriglobales bacterium]